MMECSRIVAGAMVILAIHVGAARAQSTGWLPCGPGVCIMPAGAAAGIGTMAPDAPLTVSLNTANVAAQVPGAILHSIGADGVASRWLFDSFAAPANFTFRRANYSAAFPAALRLGDTIGSFGGYGFGATGYSATARAAVSFLASENWTDASQGTYTAFFVTQNGSAMAREAMRLTGAGYLGIGTPSPQYTLSVNGTIGAREIIVSNSGWPDTVFEPGYRLLPLAGLASFVKENHHLPGIPSREEVAVNGVSVGDMQSKLLAKIEELTLHLIRLDEQNSQLETKNRALEKRVAELEERAGHGGR